MQLLKPVEVAKKLGLSVATVYQNSEKLGGFYPFGIKALRFDEVYINGMLERQKSQALVLSFSGEQKELQRQRLQNKKRSTASSFPSQRGGKKGQKSSFQYNRHGLF